MTLCRRFQIDPRKYPAAGDQSEAFNSACIESLSEGERTAVVVISGLVILFVLALIILIQLWKQVLPLTQLNLQSTMHLCSRCR